MSHIRAISANEKGNDKIIADLHGSRTCLQMIFESLKEDDRLFIAGDLIDRGEDSIGLIRDILSYQNFHPNKLFVVAGNHENMCSEAIDGLKKLANANRDIFLQSEFKKDINLVLAINDEQSRDDLIDHLDDKLNPGNDADVEKIIDDIDLFISNGGIWLLELLHEELSKGLHVDDVFSELQNFLRDLPYIIHVNDKRPFNVVHADMPMSDEELARRIKNELLTMTTNEIEQAIWARQQQIEKQMQHDLRTAKSHIAYVGHNIIIGNRNPAIRPQTNTVDLDAQCYSTQLSLLANHHLGKCELIGTGGKTTELEKLVGELNQYLDKQVNRPAPSSSKRRIFKLQGDEWTETQSKPENGNEIPPSFKK